MAKSILPEVVSEKKIDKTDLKSAPTVHSQECDDDLHSKCAGHMFECTGSDSYRECVFLPGSNKLLEDAVDALPISGDVENPSCYERTSDVEIEKDLKDASVAFETLSDREDSAYNLSNGKRLALVFNHEFFSPQSMLARRQGTGVDCNAIVETWGVNLGFEVRIYHNPTFVRIQSILNNIQDFDQDIISCLAIFILTHGEMNSILHSSDMPYHLEKHIIDPLVPIHCPALAGKPKLLFIQACQGKLVDDGIQLYYTSTSKDNFNTSDLNTSRTSNNATNSTLNTSQTSTSSSMNTARPISCCSTDVSAIHQQQPSTVQSLSQYRIPHYSDFLIFQAAYHGHYSFRSPNGSWFIQALCEHILVSDAKDDILRILTRVKRYISIYKQSNVPSQSDLNMKKQIPLVQDTLIRELYLKDDRREGDAQDEEDLIDASGSVSSPDLKSTTCRKCNEISKVVKNVTSQCNDMAKSSTESQIFEGNVDASSLPLNNPNLTIVDNTTNSSQCHANLSTRKEVKKERNNLKFQKVKSKSKQKSIFNKCICM